MRQLLYTNYQSGNSGLSNGIMSIECGAVMAFLTKRLLVIEGNVSPPANIVDYSGRVDNSHPSRVTDLLDIPVPWVEAEAEMLSGLHSVELTEHNLMDSVFYVPGTVDHLSQDASAFARGRTNWICEDEHLRDVEVLRVSEDPLVPGQSGHRHNLSFYSYLFYLDNENRRAVYELLTRMQARQPYADLADRIATDLGSFNAVHMRRGDFKVTYGVTVLDRQPWEAVDALDHHFSRDDQLLICTDERDDPFFGEIKEVWKDHIFIDHYILDHYADAFQALPTHDSLALAYLSQLVAAKSQDFMGSMTSTFTAMIQRLRGSAGKREDFKFLWNELPDPGMQIERGRHPVSECVPLEGGVMVEELEGPYSWNRCSQLLNPAWMREWPESFLSGGALASGQSWADALSSRGDRSLPTGSMVACFEGLGIRISSRVTGLIEALMDALPGGHGSGSVVAEFEIQQLGQIYRLSTQGKVISEVQSLTAVPRALLNHVVPLIARARKGSTWFQGTAIQRDDATMLIVGDWPLSSAGEGLCEPNWSLVAEEAVAVRNGGLEIVPFYCRHHGADLSAAGVTLGPIRAVVNTACLLQNQGATFALSPASAAAELSRSYWEFRLNRDQAMTRLCEMVTQVPVYQLNYSSASEASALLATLADSLAAVGDS